VTLFARSGMSITPTLFNSAAMYAFDRSLVDDARTRTLFPAWEYAAYVAKADAAGTPANAAVLALLSANVDMVLRIHRAGGFVIAGTDAPLDNPAVSLHTNLRAKVHFGFTPYEALTTATRNPARWLNLAGRIGEVRRGAYADLSFVRGNPLADINAAAAVEMVMARGKLHTIDDLLAPFTTPVATAVPALATRAAPTNHHSDQWWHESEWTHHYCCR
jgi:adenine deaminase